LGKPVLVTMSAYARYKQYFEQKAERWRERLAEVFLDNRFAGIIPTPVSKGYRSRAKYKVFGNPESISIIGTDPLLGEVSFKEALWILPPWGRNIVNGIGKVISDNSNHYWVDGFELQLAHGNKQAHVTLSVKKQDEKSYAELARCLLDNISFLEGVSIPSKKQDLGNSYLLHKIDKKNFFSQYAAFFQSNICLTPRLVKEVKNGCKKGDFRRILDLYCGVGLFSLSISDNNTPVVGVDINKRAIDSARLNAENLGHSCVSFVCSPVENFLPYASIGHQDLVIIDPPRSGCPESLIRVLSEIQPGLICSISCEPSSHIRDLKQWVDNGYEIQSIVAMDMFPFTEFLETVAFLRRTSCQR
jgi:tRNA/tmRNA/rRNA uracil-C5-methylase (TrmA/RlmC/RlmD family)